MSADYNEEAYENALIELFQNMGWEHVYGPDIDRDWYSPLYDSVLEDSIRRLNPKAAPAAIDEALLKLRHFENAELKKKNALFMEYLQNGIEVSFSANGETKSDIIYIADFENAGKPGDKNSYIVANQWTFIENSNKRPDILIFLNGLPTCLFELKSPSREQTDASEAYTQIRNYMQEILSIFIYNCVCVMSDQLTILFSGVPAASGGQAIRGSANAPLPKGNGCAAATIPNAFLLTKYRYNIGTMHIDISCHQTIQNYQK